MRPLRVSLRIVLYQEDNEWVARCLETDLIGVGSSKDEALHMLADATFTQFEGCLIHGIKDLWNPAEGRFFEMFFQGEDVVTGEFQLEKVVVDNIGEPQIELRELNDSNNHLVPA